MLQELSLFSGYGGFTLGLRLAGIKVRTVGYVEIEPYCQELLRARIRDGLLDWAPIITDIRTADFRPMAGLVDIITAGFPCQPHSAAGRRLGKEDERDLWPDTLRAIREVGPRYVLLENVRGLVDGTDPYAAEVLGQLSETGYDAMWGLVSAAEVGAPHLRWRWWCFAYSQCATISQQQGWQRYFRSTGLESSRSREINVDWDGQDGDVADAEGEPGTLWTAEGERQGRSSGSGVDLANANSPSGGHGNVRPSPLLSHRSTQEGNQIRPGNWWAIEPPLGRVAHGVADRVGQLRALGNGVVPAVVAEFLNKQRLLDEGLATADELKEPF